MSLSSQTINKSKLNNSPLQVRHLEGLVKTYSPLKDQLQNCLTWDSKIAVLEQFKDGCLQRESPSLHSIISVLKNPFYEYLLKVLATLGQFDHVVRPQEGKGNEKNWNALFQILEHVELFYDPIGGLIGYYLKVIELLLAHMKQTSSTKNTSSVLMPPKVDVRLLNEQVEQWIAEGIEHLPEIAEIYPVGGAGDRLNLRDPFSNKALPAARLLFLGRTLLEGLVRDIQSREYLYYRLHGSQITTPLILMTSHEKDNDQEVGSICEKHNWFHRPADTFFRVVQPLIPVITIDGYFSVAAPLCLNLKPGGHGVIWKLAEDSGAFDWLASRKRNALIVRQMNNPLAGLDYGLLALLGYGIKENKLFGFASCPRCINTAEGMNVLVETAVDTGYAYCITNIEYTDFEMRGVHDIPSQSDPNISQYPANTNILYAQVKAIRRATQENPFPGLIVNAKTTVSSLNNSGQIVPTTGARLESTMQNIADSILDFSENPLREPYPSFQTFLMYNERSRTISTTKHSFDPTKKFKETPEGCFYDLMASQLDLLNRCCYVRVPQQNSIESYLKEGPNLIFLYHPALGPLYSVIAQKVRRGVFHENSEVILEIAEVDIENLTITGSLIVYAKNVMGHIEPSTHVLHYSEQQARLCLKNVTVTNAGIDREATDSYWKQTIIRKQSLSIHLIGNSEFEAHNVQFVGDVQITVPDGMKAIAVQKDEKKVQIDMFPIKAPTWKWDYRFDSDKRVVLKRV